jgi:hypothetical protein
MPLSKSGHAVSKKPLAARLIGRKRAWGVQICENQFGEMWATSDQDSG